MSLEPDIADSDRRAALANVSALRRSLDDLALRRRLTRLFDGLLIGAALIVGAGFVYYRLDRWLTLHLPARAFLTLIGCALLLTYAWFRLAKTLFERSDAVQTALGMQRRRRVDAELVAALQFGDALQSGRDGDFGSPRLTAVAAARGAALGLQMDPAAEPVAGQPVAARIGLAIVPLAAVVWALVWPDHFLTFVDRLALGGARYPTNTQIVRATVNGRTHDFPRDARGRSSSTPPEFVVPANSTIDLSIETAGRRAGHAKVVVRAGGMELTSVEMPPDSVTPNKFACRLSALVERATLELGAGDGVAEIVVIARPLPLIAATLDPMPPSYALGANLLRPERGSTSAAVLPGSDVAIEVEGLNKPLRSATMRLKEHPPASQASSTVVKVYEIPLTSVDESHRIWRADPTTPAFELAATQPGASPLKAVAASYDYVIIAVDDDDFSPAEALRGSITLRADEPPTVTAEMITKFVLPTGKPNIVYRASDDLGLRSLTVSRHVARSDGTTADAPLPIEIPPETTHTALAGRLPVPLDDMQLHKGDRVTICIEARDRTGDQGLAASRSESFTLEVTDEQGLYEAMAETDQRSALKMDEIIQKQLLMTGRALAPGAGNEPPPNLPLPPPEARPSFPAPSSSATLPSATVPSAILPSASASPSSSSTGTKP